MGNFAPIFHRGAGVSSGNYNIRGNYSGTTTICGSRWEILSIQQLGVPVGNVNRIEKRHPLFITRQAEGFLHERSPSRCYGLAPEEHSSLLGSPATLAAVAFVA